MVRKEFNQDGVIKPQDFSWQNYPGDQNFNELMARYLFRQTAYDERAIQGFVASAERVKRKDVFKSGYVKPLLTALSYFERENWNNQNPPGFISTYRRREKDMKKYLEELKRYKIEYWLSKDAYFRLKGLLEESIEGQKFALVNSRELRDFAYECIYLGHSEKGVLKINSDFDHKSCFYASPRFELRSTEEINLEEVIGQAKDFIAPRWEAKRK